MESFVHLRKGRTPRRLHADLDGLKDDELGRGGFTGRTANMYRRHDPTAYRVGRPAAPHRRAVQRAQAQRRHRRRRRAAADVHQRRLPGLAVAGAASRCRSSSATSTATCCASCTRAAGLLETEFGPLRYREGDWVYIPKACTWRQVPDERDDAADDRGHRRVPGAAAGAAGPPLPVRPVAGHHSRAGADRRRDGRDGVRGPADPRGRPDNAFYQHNPLDVEGWRGDNFAFTFNIADYNVVTSDSVHLPPTVHLFMQATGVYVMNFLPKPAEGVPGTERTPWYHRNVDYDEIAFFHGGSLYGIPMPPGLISHAPQGVHHGAPEKARERARRKFDEYARVDWQVIAIDTRRRLTPSAEVLAHDLGQH